MTAHQVKDKNDTIVRRVVAGVVVVADVFFAFSLERVVQGLEIFWKVAVMNGHSLLAGTVLAVRHIGCSLYINSVEF